MSSKSASCVRSIIIECSDSDFKFASRGPAQFNGSDDFHTKQAFAPANLSGVPSRQKCAAREGIEASVPPDPGSEAHNKIPRLVKSVRERPLLHAPPAQACGSDPDSAPENARHIVFRLRLCLRNIHCSSWARCP